EEPMQTTHDLEEPSHPEFETGAADDQHIAEASQHPEWFSQQKKPPTLDHDWNKTLPATHGSIQTWISELARQTDSRSSFNELMDIPMDFSAFLMNRLKVDTLTMTLQAGLTYELMKGSCKSLHPEWFSQQKKPPTLDRDWNKTLPDTHGSIQPLISELAKQTDSRSSFNELMDTLVDFSAFLMNRLKAREQLRPRKEREAENLGARLGPSKEDISRTTETEERKRSREPGGQTRSLPKN
nr:hypothetical protein [Tanacetum cinerariifolium]